MSILGIPVTTGGLWLLGAAGAGIAYLIPIWRDRHNRFVAASADFRAAFADTRLRLRTGREVAPIIIYQNHTKHVTAIFAFQPYVVWYLRGSFDRAGKEYARQANIQRAKDDPIEALILDHFLDGPAQRAALLASVEHLLKYASDT